MRKQNVVVLSPKEAIVELSLIMLLSLLVMALIQLLEDTFWFKTLGELAGETMVTSSLATLQHLQVFVACTRTSPTLLLTDQFVT